LTLVGYGATSFTNDDFGTKRVGLNRVEQVNEHEFTLRNQTGNDSLICSGDSGGPALAMIDGTLWQVGVHSRGDGGDDDPCSAGGTHYEARIDPSVPWILEYSDGEVMVEDERDRVAPTVAIEQPQDGQSVAVSPAVTRIEVRADDDVRLQFVDLYIAGVHSTRLTGPPYRFDALFDSSASPAAIEARAVDATGKQTRAAITVIASAGSSGSAADGGLVDGDGAAANGSTRVAIIRGSGGCAYAATPAHCRAGWLSSLAALALWWGWRRRCSSR
jgi:hypothetical protein